MSSIISTYTTNWVKIKDDFRIEEHIRCLNEKVECFDSGDGFTVNHYKGQIRITAFDVIDQSFGYYEDEDEEVWIDLEEEITGLLVEGEVLRVTSLSWFKSRLDSINISVTTWDGRHETRSSNTLFDDLSQVLEIDKKKLGGWN